MRELSTSNPLYLDGNGTTKVYESVQSCIGKALKECYSNPSTMTPGGEQARKLMEEARSNVIKFVVGKSADAGGIVWNSGGTEGDMFAISLALKLFEFAAREEEEGKSQGAAASTPPPIVISTNVEHPAVAKYLQYLDHSGSCQHVQVPVDESTGVASPQVVSSFVVAGKTALVTAMYAQNETGAVNDVAEMCKLVKAKDPNVLFHTDAAQAVGKVRLEVGDVDLVTIVGHKFGAPKGEHVAFPSYGDAPPA